MSISDLQAEEKPTMAAPINQSDLSAELSRTYHYPNGDTFSIQNPKTLFWKRDEHGESHRVQSQGGPVFYLKRGWIAISWYPMNQNNPVQF